MPKSSRAAAASAWACSGMFDSLRKNRFLVLGRAGMDLYADPPGSRTEEASRFTSALGGSAANIAAGIVKLGGDAALLTTVSDDAVGRFVLRELDRYGVDRAHVRVVGAEARTSLAVVETRLENCQSVIYRNGAADFALSAEDVAPVDFAGYGALIVTGTALAVEPSRSATVQAMTRARSAQTPVILDVDYRPYSWSSAAEAAEISRQAAESSDIVIGNDVEFDVMAGGSGGLALARNLAAHLSAVIYKMGERGSIAFEGERNFETAIDRVAALKPTGAGDAFMAGVVTGLASGLDLRASVQRGTAAAAIVVTGVGCAPASPTARELYDFMRRHTKPA
jgi:5-dehydro-2-deoxygluconokinase